MPHFRNRHITHLLKSSLRFSSLVGIFGHRQVGKTTLAEKLAGNYLTLDNPEILEQAFSSPASLLSANKSNPLSLDECQLAPPLFPALKEWVRVNKKPGQVLLTGSVRFSSRKAIRESLTGRLIGWELLPLDFGERHNLSLGNTIPKLLDSKTIEIDLRQRLTISDDYPSKMLELGGLPGIFAVRNSSIRAQKFETQINTILERDLRLILETSLSYRTLRNLFSILALHQTQPIEWADLSRKSRISIPTLRKLIPAFENMFLIRLVPTEGSEKKPIIFLEDQGEATFLSAGRYDEFTNLFRFLYNELRTQAHYRPELGIRIFQYRNRGGACVPLCFAKGHSVVGIIPSLEEHPNESATRSAASFFKKYPNSKVLIVHRGQADLTHHSMMRSLGIGKLL